MPNLKCFLLGLLLLATFANCSNAQSSTNGEATKLKELKSEKVIKEIKKGKSIAYVNTIFDGDFDFSQVGEPEVSSISYATVDVKQEIFFFNCVFLGKVTTNGKLQNSKTKIRTRFDGNVHFSECEFRKEVDFSKSVVNGDLSFAKSKFDAPASFNGILVNGLNALFYEIEANDNFNFAGTTIRGNISFLDGVFKKNFNFSGLRANNVILNNLNAEGRFALSEATIDGILQINYATFKGECNLSFSKFSDRVEILHSNFEKLFTIDNSHFWGNAKFNKSSFADSIVTKDAQFWMTPEMKEIEKNTAEPIYVEVKNSNTILISQ